MDRSTPTPESWQDLLEAMPPWARKLAAMANEQWTSDPATDDTPTDDTPSAEPDLGEPQPEPRAGRPRPPGPFGWDDQIGAAISRAFGAGQAGGAGGAPWGRSRARASRGDVRAAILSLLLESSMHGYQLMQEMSRRSEGAWRPSPGSVYPTLSQLEDEGLVQGQDDAGRRVFTLTDDGRSAATADGAEQAPWDSVGGRADDRTETLRTGVKGVMTAARAVGATGTPEQLAAAATLLDDTRKSLYRILADG